MEEKSISIYEYTSELDAKCKFYLEKSEYKTLIEKANASNCITPLLSEVFPASLTLKSKIINLVRHPFYQKEEFRTKMDYLSYLKNIYEFLISTFDDNNPGNKKIAENLLTEFYLEVKLIESITDELWEKISKSKNPELEISRLIYGIKFEPKFKEFLEKIPWRIAKDVYKAPLFDGAHFHLAGTELPKKKPILANEKFLECLISEDSYKEIIFGEKKAKTLKNKDQIIDEISKKGQAVINLYQGVSKYEGDFLIQQQLQIYPNPNHKDKLLSRLFERQKPYLFTITERIIPLEIKFLDNK